jgi:hypothetical protein
MALKFPTAEHSSIGIDTEVYMSLTLQMEVLKTERVALMPSSILKSKPKLAMKKFHYRVTYNWKDRQYYRLIGNIYRKSVAKSLKAFGYRLAIDISNTILNTLSGMAILIPVSMWYFEDTSPSLENLKFGRNDQCFQSQNNNLLYI